MKTAYLLIKCNKFLRIFFTLFCLLILYASPAKSAGPTPDSSQQRASLILKLPQDEIKTDNAGGAGNGLVLQQADANQMALTGKRKTPLNVDCGMDIFPANNPDISLSSRLTGECDVKYHF